MFKVILTDNEISLETNSNIVLYSTCTVLYLIVGYMVITYILGNIRTTIPVIDKLHCDELFGDNRCLSKCCDS